MYYDIMNTENFKKKSRIFNQKQGIILKKHLNNKQSLKNVMQLNTLTI